MTFEDFVQQPRGPRLFDFWLAKQPLSTPIGSFEIALHEAPDEELVACVNNLVEFVVNNFDDVLEVIYDHYQQTAEHKDWMKGCEVPIGLARHRVAKYVRSRSITVRRDRNQTVEGTISIIPKWDTEHGIHVSVLDGRLVPQDA